MGVMNEQPPADTAKRLEQHQQSHLLRWWPELSEGERSRLLEQISQLDFESVAGLVAKAKSGDGDNAGDTAARARRATEPRGVVRQPGNNSAALDEWNDAFRHGEELLRAGKVGAILVAGGQGTRLGFDKPKGMFTIGPVSGRSLFQVLSDQIRARIRRYGRSIPFYVMTSDATHDETVEYFEANNYLGLDRRDVAFFRQGNMPSVDAKSGQVLLAEKGTLTASPDGHGGILAALANSGLLDDMQLRGIEHLYYHQVDNPTAIVCDPALIGFHAKRQSELTTKVVPKVSASERMGVVVDVDGQTQIIEYSDMPADVAARVNSAGELMHWAGNMAIHVFDRAFLERLASSGDSLPFHIAHKKVPYVDAEGQLKEPDEPNAYKFERFIFDALPLAKRALVVEADRSGEFNPVKNASGSDSPETARNAMNALYRNWLEAAGAKVAEGVVVEISPLFALDADEVRGKIQPSTRFDKSTYLS